MCTLEILTSFEYLTDRSFDFTMDEIEIFDKMSCGLQIKIR